ncbi:MAG: GntR family transcriptional regulator [Chitinivibrionales bacterium]|nr:GntR family transcriptional regulator [Chitinivibrionales bacterium]
MNRLDAFRDWLDNALARATPDQRLPTNAQLARQWRLSEATIRRVLRSYAEQGLVESIRGSGTFARPTTPTEEPAPQAPRSAHQALADSLAEAIARADLRRGDPLPLVKSLCTQYHVTPSTVTAAYRLLARQGLAVRAGRRYRVGQVTDVTRPFGWEQVALVYDAARSLQDLIDGLLWRPALEEMEMELQGCRHRLTYLQSTDIDRSVQAWKAQGRFPRGIVLVSDGRLDIHSMAERLLRILPSRIRRPTIVLAGDRPKALPAGVQAFTHGHIPTTRAREIARLCAHHRVGCLAVFVGAPPPRPSAARDALRLVPELDSLSPGTALEFIVRRSPTIATPRDYFAFLRAYFPDSYLLGLAGKSRAVDFGTLEHACVVVDSDAERLATLPKGSMACFLSDDHAADALSWCEAHTVRVPWDLSILGTHNCPRHYHLGLSCCVADWRAIGYQLAHALIGDLPVERTRRGYIRTRARIIHRQTTP